MAGLIPFNRRGTNLPVAGFEDFYNMLDDFFGDNWFPSRSLVKDTFKIDIKEADSEYLVEAELPGISRDEISLDIKDENLCISINREENLNQEGKNYLHRERRVSSMNRSIRLGNTKLDEIKAKLENGILTITVPKRDIAENTRKIEIE